MNNYVNPYLNPYGQQFQNYQPQTMPQQQVTKVNGENGARAYQIGANSSALLLDESGAMIWLITTDGAGYKTATPYDISPHQIATAPDYSLLESRIAKLEEYMNGHSTDSTAIKRKPNGQFASASNASAD